MAKVHVGLSGYSYKEWQGEGRFYPPDIKQKGFLGFYCEHYDSVEMDGSWYRMPTTEAVQAWIASTPESFQFCFKAHRGITHIARLKEEGIESLKFMLGRLVPVARAGKLGPLLLQLPPNLKRGDDRLKAFFEQMPTRIPVTEDDGSSHDVRYAIEFRNETWHCQEVEDILREHNVAWVAADTDDANAQRRDTADFHYSRLRKTAYSDESLTEWAGYFAGERGKGKDSYVFCKHEDAEAPWEWADILLDRLRS